LGATIGSDGKRVQPGNLNLTYAIPSTPGRNSDRSVLSCMPVQSGVPIDAIATAYALIKSNSQNGGVPSTSVSIVGP
jgi:hypothetical protein